MTANASAKEEEEEEEEINNNDAKTLKEKIYYIELIVYLGLRSTKPGELIIYFTLSVHAYPRRWDEFLSRM